MKAGVYINLMPPPAIQKFLNQLDRITVPSLFKSFTPHRYEPLSMATSAPTDRTAVTKADMDFSEDVEASRTSSKHDENAHIQHVELTEEDVCPLSQCPRWELLC
jgi:hypothetical protein